MKKLLALFLRDYFILILILVNSLIIFLQGFEFDKNLKLLLYNLDNVITILFLLELIIKTTHYGIKSYLSSGWNIFDTILILMALPSLYYWITVNGQSQLDYLLVLRISRVFKFFRFIKFFPNIDDLINGVRRALKASLVILLGFFVFVFIISVLSCFLYRDIAPQYFNNPLISFYTIFRIFTVEGWYEIPEVIANNSSDTISLLSRIYFAVILLLGGVFGLSLVNSIFVDAMVSDNNDELEKKIDSLEKKINKLIDNQ